MKESHDKLGRLLAAGVTASAICFAAGLIVTLASQPAESALAQPILDAGLIILMLTPLVRVLVSLLEELRDRNWFFAAITLAVVAVLCATLWTSL
jgi:uncharacterized membrane protein